MRKNGFTLIEIIGVLVVLAMIILLTLPNLMETLRRAEEKTYDDFLKTIELISENYISDNEELLDLTDPGDSLVIKVKDLIDSGLINSKIINPKTEKVINEDDFITVTVETDKTMKYEFESIDNRSAE